MAVGDVTELEIAAQEDPLTGAPVERLSDDYGNACAPYFTQNLCSPDGERLLVASDREGGWQLFDLDMSAGRLVQLTNEKDLHHGGAVRHPSEPLAYYFAGRLLKEVDLQDQTTRTLYALPDGFRPAILSLSGDGRRLAFAYTERLSFSTGSGRMYSRMREHLYRRPASVVVYVETATGVAEAVWGEREWISHVNVSPTEPETVLFCHEGPWHLVQRMWVVNARTSRVHPLIEQEPHLEKAGHEFFLADGRVGTQYSERRDVESGWTHYATVVRPDGSGRQDYRWDGDQPVHIQCSPDGDLWVGDTAPAPGMERPGEALCLFRCADGVVEPRPLCLHGTSWQRQRSHPHPFFTPAGTPDGAPEAGHVIFNSDRGGNINVYRVPARRDGRQFGA